MRGWGLPLRSGSVDGEDGHYEYGWGGEDGEDAETLLSRHLTFIVIIVIIMNQVAVEDGSEGARGPKDVPGAPALFPHRAGAHAGGVEFN